MIPQYKDLHFNHVLFFFVLAFISENMQSTVDHYLESKHMFYSARYSDNLLVNLGGDFSKVSQTTLVIFYFCTFCTRNIGMMIGFCFLMTVCGS